MEMKDSLPLEQSLVITGTPMAMLPKYVRADFQPQEDITAYELARLLVYFYGNRGMTETEWELLGTMQRHLKRRE